MASKKDIKKAFDVFDLEQEGRIRADELENALRIAKMNPTSKDVDEIKRKLGEPEMISYEQFEDIVEEISSIDQKAELREAFACFDTKNLGYITPGKLKEIVKPMLGEDLTEAELDKIIIDADKDNNGKIELDEFVAFMMGE